MSTFKCLIKSIDEQIDAQRAIMTVSVNCT